MQYNNYYSFQFISFKASQPTKTWITCNYINKNSENKSAD